MKSEPGLRRGKQGETADLVVVDQFDNRVDLYLDRYERIDLGDAVVKRRRIVWLPDEFVLSLKFLAITAPYGPRCGAQFRDGVRMAKVHAEDASTAALCCACSGWACCRAACAVKRAQTDLSERLAPERVEFSHGDTAV